MLVIQVFFGVGEAGAFPIATRSLSRWMRPTERGFAQGVTHAGSRLGAALTPPIVVLIIARFGWRAAFLVFGVLGVMWAATWFLYYRDTPE
jgi:MFS family permease